MKASCHQATRQVTDHFRTLSAAQVKVQHMLVARPLCLPPNRQAMPRCEPILLEVGVG